MEFLIGILELIIQSCIANLRAYSEAEFKLAKIDGANRKVKANINTLFEPQVCVVHLTLKITL